MAAPILTQPIFRHGEFPTSAKLNSLFAALAPADDLGALQGVVAGLTTDLATETAARIAGDNAEAAARIAGDATLASSISGISGQVGGLSAGLSGEMLARQGADGAEAAARIAGDNAEAAARLQGIAQEAQWRTDADNAEAAARSNADAAETGARTSADNAEAAARAAADAALEASKMGNPAVGANWIRFPGGPMFQWFHTEITVNVDTLLTLPQPFPNSFTHVICSYGHLIDTGNGAVGAEPANLQQFRAININAGVAGTGSIGIYFLCIGS